MIKIMKNVKKMKNKKIFKDYKRNYEKFEK